MACAKKIRQHSTAMRKLLHKQAARSHSAAGERACATEFDANANAAMPRSIRTFCDGAAARSTSYASWSVSTRIPATCLPLRELSLRRVRCKAGCDAALRFIASKHRALAAALVFVSGLRFNFDTVDLLT